ncbi:unnamed protein product [Phaedon cochleariae]|uniref:Uncharacterized protein n=1 Tax=Phaedon cochleariae TaxID=80249 RepID=A0A9P0DV87_PHACE|nr:unnamed protein product [Phaedon cochleariae]
MSATVEANTASWRKRHREEDQLSQMDRKRPRNYYYRLESESSKASEEDTESVYSLQDRETDICRDTTDTDTDSKADISDQDEYELFEYEVASLSGSDNGSIGNSSSGSEDHMFLAAAVEAICDSSLETWITDCEESDNSSSLDDSFITRSGFSRCVQCKSENDNPLYRYCEKCFQQSCRQCKMRKTYKCFTLCISCHKDRKKFFPPRPKGNKKTRKPTKKKSHPDAPVKLDLLRSCLSGLSQDSGIGSSQECPPLGLDQIIVPDEHLRPGTSSKPNLINAEDVKVPPQPNLTIAEVKAPSQPTPVTTTPKRKRDLSESSLSDFEIVKKSKPQRPKTLALSQSSELGSEASASSFSSTTTEKSTSDTSELCIFCNSAPKDSIFLHTNVAHQCCCYRCAKRTLHTIKRCPICNRSVNKVVRIFTS